MLLGIPRSFQFQAFFSGMRDKPRDDVMGVGERLQVGRRDIYIYVCTHIHMRSFLLVIYIGMLSTLDPKP